MYVCVYFVCFCFILHSCYIAVSMVGWTWWDWSLILRTYIPSVIWHCCLGHMTCKNLFPIWPIMCLVRHQTLLYLYIYLSQWPYLSTSQSAFDLTGCSQLHRKWSYVHLLQFLLGNFFAFSGRRSFTLIEMLSSYLSLRNNATKWNFVTWCEVVIMSPSHYVIRNCGNCTKFTISFVFSLVEEMSKLLKQHQSNTQKLSGTFLWLAV